MASDSTSVDIPVDLSPYQPVAAEKIPHASNVILIDNYDSFTWNVYQYLVLEGATVTVHRNDQITLKELVELKPTQLVISPGPGHPVTDSGVSRDAILHFGGKIPVLGVCMGEQCMYSVYGGTVDVTGEIFHGKTSTITHDGKGVFAGVDQNIAVTRYHSLAGTHSTLPDPLEISAWTKLPDGKNNIVMAIRHKEFVMEGVQFHPESILSEQGRLMIRNFLMMQGGTWAENEKISKQSGETTKGTEKITSPTTDSKEDKRSILQVIYDHRRAAVEEQKNIPAHSFANLQKAYDLGLAPPNIDFPARLAKSPFPVSLMAEIKRASPSKGMISIDACAPAQARTYALAGSSVISVLTEPEWFKGSIDDLRQVRQALDGLPNRPAVLRKEFIFDEYQILEARVAGADTVLLIVKMLDEDTLRRLYKYSQSVGMEPLVEVNTPEEMKIAVSLGSRVIGVNNRNLCSFEVDLGTTTRLLDLAPTGTIVCALSGISGPEDVKEYQKQGVKAVLVGEALMRAPNPLKFAGELLGGCEGVSTVAKPKKVTRLVKICGTRSAAAAKAAIEAGADLVGIILVQGRRRCVSNDIGREISAVVHSTQKPHYVEGQGSDLLSISSPRRALLVGVFQNQSLEYILAQIRDLDLDIVQLHGDESIELSRMIPVPVMRVHQLGGSNAREVQVRGCRSGYHSAILLDSLAGGTGEKIDLDKAVEWVRKEGVDHDGLAVPVMLAGGLSALTVRGVIERLDREEGIERIVGVDVSSGVEGEDGNQDLDKIRKFVSEARLG